MIIATAMKPNTIVFYCQKYFYLSILISVFVIIPTYCQDEPDTLIEEKIIFDSSRAKFDSLWKQSKDIYEKFYQSELNAFKSYKKKIEDIWGEYSGSTKTKWVEYNEETTTRSIVDFENGEATVEALLEPLDSQNEDLVKQKLINGIKDLVTSKGKSKDYDSSEEPAVTLSDQPVLTGQVQNNSGDEVSVSNAEEFAEETIKNSTIQYSAVTGEDNKERVVSSINFSLAPNQIRVRAEKYTRLIEKYCNRFGLPQNLVFAIMHTESFYNPKAISTAPAYGLMQLVPSSGGRDAYLFVYGKDELVTPNYLYDAEQNIELGTAYLHILLNQHFHKVRDSQSRTYCAIAAYNTGPSNVSRTFVNSKDLESAIQKINTMTSSKVYEYMTTNLPYQETRDYLVKVTRLMEQYASWTDK
jgi:membrane-bound lytic murein transglycosylase C